MRASEGCDVWTARVSAVRETGVEWVGVEPTMRAKTLCAAISIKRGRCLCQSRGALIDASEMILRCRYARASEKVDAMERARGCEGEVRRCGSFPGSRSTYVVRPRIA